MVRCRLYLICFLVFQLMYNFLSDYRLVLQNHLRYLSKSSSQWQNTYMTIMNSLLISVSTGTSLFEWSSLIRFIKSFLQTISQIICTWHDDLHNDTQPARLTLKKILNLEKRSLPQSCWAVSWRLAKGTLDRVRGSLLDLTYKLRIESQGFIN